MAIEFLPETKEFHLHNSKVSYILCILENGYAGQLYFGPALESGRSYRHLYRTVFDGFSNRGSIFVHFEYPSAGNGDYRVPAVTLTQEDGSSVIEPVYLGHRIYAGKEKIPGLPATYVDEAGEADTLELDLGDKKSGAVITLCYTIFRDYAAIARHVRIKNGGSQKLMLHCAMSASLDLPDQNWDLVTLTGAWARECHINSRHLVPGTKAYISSKYGESSHYQNPFIMLKRPDTNETKGEAYGFSLVYSGNFLAEVEADPYNSARVRIGINPDGFAWELAPGAVFDTPEAVLAASNQGLGGISDALHGLYSERLVRGEWRGKERPVLINNWEGTYFNFTEERLVEIAEAAKDLGVELFVLDDGWFGKRDSDTCSLGDWQVNRAKLPHGIDGLAKKVNELGLKFGLWIEPEMISPKSELYGRHPDWAAAIPGRPRTEERHQYVLDFSRPEIVDYIFGELSALFSSANISYIKWDMNRPITEPFSLSLPAARQGEFFHRYCLGVYSLYERLREKFPHILFESCSGGGGRFDPGMLYYAPQAWASDDSDAIERIKIQWGLSLCYPQSAMGAHVSAVPNHQTGRITPLQTRAAVAFFGAFGYELDATKLPAGDRETIREQIAFYKQYRPLFQQGRFVRLLSPYEGNDAAWMVVSPDKKKAIVAFFRVLNQPTYGPWNVKLSGLDPALSYQVSTWPADVGDSAETNNRGVRGGDELMNAGLIFGDDEWYRPRPNDDNWFMPRHGDFWSRLFILESR